MRWVCVRGGNPGQCMARSDNGHNVCIDVLRFSDRLDGSVPDAVVVSCEVTSKNDAYHIRRHDSKDAPRDAGGSISCPPK